MEEVWASDSGEVTGIVLSRRYPTNQRHELYALANENFIAGEVVIRSRRHRFSCFWLSGDLILCFRRLYGPQWAPLLFQILYSSASSIIRGTVSGRGMTLNPNLETTSSRWTRSHVPHDTRLYLLQFRRKLIPHPLLNLGSLRARHQRRRPVMPKSAISNLKISWKDDWSDRTYGVTRQSLKYCPCVSLPPSTALTRLRLPCSVLLAKKNFITASMKGPSRASSEWQRPGLR